MTIREKVARALHHARLADDDVDIAINAFLAAAAEKGWHMRPDEATKEMDFAGSGCCWQDQAPRCYSQMLAAAPEFEWDK